MNKTLPILLIVLLFSFNLLSAQELPLSIDNVNNNQKNKNSKATFQSIVDQYENYFFSIEVDKKGSGYKPFKRWEYHWSHYLQEDGTIAPASHLWKAWEQKQKMTKSAQAVSNWTTKGPFSQSSNSGQGRINTVVVDPNNVNLLYVGAPSGGLWKSTDNGVNWTPLIDNLPQIGVSGIAIDPNNSNIIYISTGDDDAGDSYSIGVLKSTDGGVTWSQTGAIDGSPNSSNEISIDPSNSNSIWVATSNGLFQSINGGTTWESKLSGNIKDFKFKPGDATTVYAVTNNKFYKSVSGSAFTVTTFGLPSSTTIGRMTIEVTPAAPDNVYVLAASNNNYTFLGVFKSIDNGTSFTKTDESNDIFGTTQAWYDLAFTISPTDENIMFVGVLDIWKSVDGGNDFTKINAWNQITPTYTHADIHFMRYYNGNLYAGTDGGVYKSTNNGGTFTDLTENLSISQFYKVSVSKKNSNKLAGGLQDNGGFLYASNIWHNYHGGDGMDAAADPNDENTFYGFMQYGQFLFKTNNSGVNGSTVVSGPSNGNWVTPLVANKGSDIYAGYRQLYKLTNDEWSQISNHNFEGNIGALEIDPSNNNNIFASRNLNLYISKDKGVTFTTQFSRDTGLTGSFISSIEVHHSDGNIVWVTTAGVSSNVPSSGHTGGGVFKSVDGGLTFTNITDNLPNESKFVVRHHPFTTNNSIYVGTALGVYHRNDDTDTWEVFSTNLPNVAVSDIEINSYDNIITAATYGRSVWQSPIPAITLPANDIDLLKINLSDGVLSCGDVSSKIIVQNNGQNSITSFAVHYNIDGGTDQVYDWTGSIASQATTTIILPAITVTEGQHIINANLVLSNDENSNNNGSQSTFSLTVNQSGEGQYLNTFGDVNQDIWLVSDNNLWQIGMPTTNLLNGVVNSGYITNPTGNYPDQTVSHLTSPCYDLTSIQNPVLRFKMAFDLEEFWDIVYVEYSTDDSATWQILGSANEPNWYNSDRTNQTTGNDCFNCVGAQWTGTDATLKEYSYNLSPLNGQSSIMFRFKFVSDQNLNQEGVVIDDFIIEGVLGVNDFEDGEFLIYPNPSSDIFNIKRFNTVGDNMTIDVYDITGKLIRKRKNITEADYELNMTGVAKGVYFLKIKIDNKQLVKKLILK